jgi:hypothetical protein
VQDWVVGPLSVSVIANGSGRLERIDSTSAFTPWQLPKVLPTEDLESAMTKLRYSQGGSRRRARRTGVTWMEK